MSEKEGTIVVEWIPEGRRVVGGQGRPVDCGEGREGGGLFGLVGCLGGGV